MEGLKRLCDAVGISGREDNVRSMIRDDLKGLTDDLHTDALGNVIALKRGQGKKRVMLAAHMDEIGFIVNHIDEKGYLSVVPVGGIDARNLVIRQVLVFARHADQPLKGIMAPKAKPIHIMEEEDKKKVFKPTDFYIDLGLSKEEVDKLVKLGDPVSYVPDFTEIGHNVVSKSIDDRVGVYVMLEAMRRVQGKTLGADVYAVASVQEEVGLRGATVSAFGVEPDVGIALDVTIAADIPTVKESDQVSTLGGGVSISIMDGASISNWKLVEFCRTLAEKHNIKHQLNILPRGGTDAGAMQKARKGAPVISLSLPTRYIHSPSEMISKEDVEATIQLLVAFLEEVHDADFSL